MDSTTIHIATDAGMVPEPVVVASLYEALHQLSDPRRGLMTALGAYSSLAL
jgi:hypothetical protein